MEITRLHSFSVRDARIAAVVAGFCFFFIPSIFAQTPAANPRSDPVQLVRQMVQNELAAQTRDRTQWSYQELKKQDDKPQELRDVVETKDGEVDRLVSVGGRPLTPVARKKEDARLAAVSSDPDEIQKSRKAEQADAAHERAMLKILPQAFLYSDAGAENGLIKIAFRPNPSFQPPTRMDEVFHHMQGTMSD